MEQTKVCEMIKYSFNNSGLLEQALRHSSCDNDNNNERLEFLGDAVLELCTSDILYRNHPDIQEGALTKLRAELVCETSLADWAREKELGRHIVLGKSEEMTDGRHKSSILSDAVEAIIGAVFLDGGFEPARDVVERMLQNMMEKRSNRPQFRDAKSELQMLLQRSGNTTLHYEVYNQEGPAHATTFYVYAVLDGKNISQGKGKSKKQAEQDAAASALGKLLKD